MRKKKPPDNGPGVADWIVSYGDVMSLLLCFFVLLFSFSTIDAEKWRQIVESFSGKPAVIAVPVDNETAIITFDESQGMSSSVIDDMIQKDLESDMEEIPDEAQSGLENVDNIADITSDEFSALYKQLYEFASDGKENLNLEIIKSEEKITIRFDNEILFKSGEAILDTKAKALLINIISVVDNYKEELSKVYIEGNTDNVPISTTAYRDNFELSVYRALVVLYYIRDNSTFPQEMMVAVGYGEFQPIDSNSHEAGRSKNRRTDIVLLRNKTVNGEA